MTSITKSFNPRKLGVISFILMLATILFLAGSNSTTAAEPERPATTFGENVGEYSELTEFSPTANVVTVGFYGVNAYEIDTSSNTFYFKGYMWLRWSGDIDPLATLEFANSVEEWGLMVTYLTEEPTVLASGENLMAMRVQGRFFQPFDLSSYPLDKQELNIYLEDSVNDVNTIVYVADGDASGYDASFQVPGWNLKSLTATPLVHNYNSDFGDPVAAASEYSALKFSLNIERVQNLFWWKLLLPLILVLVTNWLALLLSPKFAEIRTAMPATALLTTVFLQQSSLDAIPQVSSLVLMDFIYVLAYLMIVVTFAQIVWDNHRVRSDDEQSVAGVQRLDRISILVQVVAFAIGLTLLVMTAA